MLRQHVGHRRRCRPTAPKQTSTSSAARGAACGRRSSDAGARNGRRRGREPAHRRPAASGPGAGAGHRTARSGGCGADRGIAALGSCACRLGRKDGAPCLGQRCACSLLEDRRAARPAWPASARLTRTVMRQAPRDAGCGTGCARAQLAALASTSIDGLERLPRRQIAQRRASRNRRRSWMSPSACLTKPRPAPRLHDPAPCRRAPVPAALPVQPVGEVERLARQPAARSRHPVGDDVVVGLVRRRDLHQLDPARRPSRRPARSTRSAAARSAPRGSS